MFKREDPSRKGEDKIPKILNTFAMHVILMKVNGDLPARGCLLAMAG